MTYFYVVRGTAKPCLPSSLDAPRFAEKLEGIAQQFLITENLRAVLKRTVGGI